MRRNYHQRKDHRREHSQVNKTKELKDKLTSGTFEDIDIRDLIGPKGFARNIASEVEIKQTQLRKIYALFKDVLYSAISNIDKSKDTERVSLSEELITKLYLIYPILEYQYKRGVLGSKNTEDFKMLLENVIRVIESNPTKKNLEKAEYFMTALIAYSKKDKEK